MHKIAHNCVCNAQKSFAAGAPPRPRWGSLRCSPIALVGGGGVDPLSRLLFSRFGCLAQVQCGRALTKTMSWIRPCRWPPTSAPPGSVESIACRSVYSTRVLICRPPVACMVRLVLTASTCTALYTASCLDFWFRELLSIRPSNPALWMSINVAIRFCARLMIIKIGCTGRAPAVICTSFPQNPAQSQTDSGALTRRQRPHCSVVRR